MSDTSIAVWSPLRLRRASVLAIAALLVLSFGSRSELSAAPNPMANGSGDAGQNGEKKPGYKVVDWDQNRFVVGDPRKFERPAKIVILDVLSKIPAYQQVVKEKLTEKDPRYYFLMQEAT